MTWIAVGLLAVSSALLTANGLCQNKRAMRKASRSPGRIFRIFVFGHLAVLVVLGMQFLVGAQAACAKPCQGGHASAAVSAPSTTWYLAEGYTGGDFDEWVLIQNPNSVAAYVTATFMLPDGSNVQTAYLIDPASRFSIHVDEIVPHSSVSTKIEADFAVIAERAMYFNYHGISGGHSSPGAAAASDTW